MNWNELLEKLKDGGIKIIGSLLLIILTFVAANLILKAISSYTRRAIDKANQMEDKAHGKQIVTVMSILRSVSRYLLYFFAIMISLNTMGFGANLNNVLVTAGVGSLILSFGAQSFIKDVVAGLFLIFEKQYSVGDFVKLGDYTGTVTGVATRVTYLTTVDGTKVIIPNGSIPSVINYGNKFNQAKIVVPTPYEANTAELIEKITGWLNEYYRENKENFVEPPQVLGVSEFNASSVDLTVVGKVLPLKQWQTERDWRLLIKKHFDEEGISIPYQTVTVIKSEPSEKDA
ncbi:MAG: mechanosensitive ion channel family protein [Erysipelotrichales bacterium]|nr:mechanosensitive ion channel family protein [Erysipelotrichales bacterium]